jgi:hypothetical protein
MAEWTEAAQAALVRLDGERHGDKMKATILALVDAHLAGRSEETVWGLPEACSRNTYHGKWKRDPLFAQVLGEVDALAKGWRDGRSLRALNEAAERLALASPVAVAKLIERLKSEDEGIILRAATAILDRAGIETAAKSSSRAEVEVDVSRLSDEELQAILK